MENRKSCSCNQHNCKHGYCIDNIPIFSDLPFNIKENIMDSSNHKKYKKGEIIFSPGDYFDYLFVVNKGRVKISKISAMGKEQILRILEVGDFIGELSLFKDSVFSNSAEAMAPTEICIIKSDIIRQLIIDMPDIALKFLQKYTERIQQSEELIEQIGLRDVEQRIANYFISEIEKNNITCRNNEYELNLSISKGVLSSLLGTTQETLSRKLSAFQDEGIIRLEGHRKIFITDIETLKGI